MTFSLKHSFTSPKADGTDATLVQPSNWNAEHTITLAAGKVLGRDASGAGAVQELPLSFDATGQSMIPPSGTTAQRPSTAAAGMLRYNTTTSKFELYNGTAWGSVGGGASISDTAPSNAAAGDLWWKSDEGQMYVYYTDANSSQWVISNAFAGSMAGFLPLTGGAISGDLSVAGATTLTGALVPSSSFKRNRIINGNMLIDQRNAGASSTAAGYTVDRWFYNATQTSKGTWQQNAGSVTPPAGFANYWGFTSSSAYSVSSTDTFGIQQYIEGFNLSDLAWGTSSASSVTLSFWVRSSLTGTFGGVLKYYGASVSYPFSYTISAANTWTQISVVIPGYTTTALPSATSGGALVVNFNLGSGSTLSGTPGAWVASSLQSSTGAVSVVGTSGATFYITGVQLEVGTKATPYEMQIYSDQLAQCQRYFEKSNFGYTTIGYKGPGASFKVPKRAIPTLTFYSGSDASGTAGYVTETQNTGSIYSVTVSSATVDCMLNVNTGIGINATITGSYFASAEL